MKNKFKRLSLLGASFIALSGVSSIVLGSCGSTTPSVIVGIKTIDVERKPTKRDYIVGEKLDLTGIVVHKVMTDGSWTVLDKSEYTTIPAEGSVLTEVNASLKVRVILNEDNNHYQEFPITVSEDPTPIIEQTGKPVYEKVNNTYKVTGLSNASEKIKTITVEAEYNGLPVTEIEKGALANCPNLQTVKLPFIGRSNEAEGAEALFGWVFGDTMFEGCGGFTWQEYDVDESNETVTKYGSYCIPLTLENVEVTNATKIAPGAFSKCRYLSNITINDFNGTTIGNKAFYNCTGIHSFNIDGVKGLEVVEHSAFLGCATLQYINLPSTLKTIEESAFAYCVACAKANIPSSVEKVKHNAFTSVSGIILVEASETTVKEKWDSDWTEAETPVVYDFGSESSYGYDKDWLVMVCGSGQNKYGYLIQWMGSWEQTEIIFPSKLTVNGEELDIKIIGGRCFQENTFLNYVHIPEGIEHIYGNTFEGCTNLKYVDFPSTLKTIRDDAFNGCKSLVGHYEDGQVVKTIDLINVTSIGNRAFSECTSILDLNLEQVQTIGDEAFAYCTHLCPDTTEKEDNCLLIPATCTSIGEGAFKYCFKYAPDSVTTTPYYPTIKFADNNQIEIIPESCFERCGVRDTKPKEGWDAGVQYPKQIRVNVNLNGAHLKRIENAAFKNCWIANLSGARNTHLTYIGDYAFYYAQPTSDLDTPGGKQDLQMDQEIEYIGDYAFAYCTTVKSLTFNTAIDYDDGSKVEQYYNSLKHLGQYAFYGCSNQDFNYLDLSPCVNLKNYIRDDLEETEKDPAKYPQYTPRYAFAQCSNLQDVYLPGSYKYVEKYPEEERAGIIADHPCNDFTRLPARIFEGCTCIGKTGTELTIPKQINDIRAAALNGCTYLQKVYIDGKIYFYDSSIFYNNYNLESITKSNGDPVEFDTDNMTNSTVGSSIYYNCYKLKNGPMPIIETTSFNFNLRDNMYYQNKKLETITIPYNCYTVGSKSFMECDSLTSVSFTRKPTSPTSANVCTYIYASAFSGCENLEEINLYDTSLTYLYNESFKDCVKLGTSTDKPFKLPNRTIVFYSKPFEGWKNTQTIYFGKNSVHNTGSWWSSWTSTQSTWPENFYWNGNRASSSIPLYFERQGTEGNYYYTCKDNACGGTSVHFIPYF